MRFPDSKRSAAIFVGTSSYHELEDLPAVTKCLEKLREIFAEPTLGTFSKEKCHKLEDPSSAVDLAKNIEKLAADVEDVLIVWIIGHGLIDIADRTLYVALQGTEQAKLRLTSLPFISLKEAIQVSPAKIKLLVLDCCFSGKALAEAGSMGDLATAVAETAVIEGTFIVTSCAGNEISLSPPGDEYTAFTGAAIEALESSEAQTVSQLYAAITKKQKQRDLHLPRQSATALAGDLALLRPAGHVTDIQLSLILSEDTDADGLASTVLGFSSLGEIEKHSQALSGNGNSDEGKVNTPSEQTLDQLLAAAEAIQPSTEPDPERAIASLRKIITQMIRESESDNPLVLHVRELQILWLGRMKRFAEAAKLAQRILKTREAALGPDDRLVMRSQHNYAHLVGSAGEPQKAVDLFEALVEKRERILGAHDDDTILAREGLATWTGLSGDPGAAAGMYEVLCEDLDWRNGPQDQWTLRLQAALARWREASGDHAGAMQAYARAAEDWASIGGPDCEEASKYVKLRDYCAQKVHYEG